MNVCQGVVFWGLCSCWNYKYHLGNTAVSVSAEIHMRVSTSINQRALKGYKYSTNIEES